MASLVGSVAVIGLMLVVFGVPLAMDRVQPNGLYGYRTAKTLGNRVVWFAANRYSGRAMVVAGLVTLGFAAALFAATRWMEMSFVVLSVCAVAAELVPLLVAVGFSYRFVAGL